MIGIVLAWFPPEKYGSFVVALQRGAKIGYWVIGKDRLVGLVGYRKEKEFSLISILNLILFSTFKSLKKKIQKHFRKSQWCREQIKATCGRLFFCFDMEEEWEDVNLIQTCVVGLY